MEELLFSMPEEKKTICGADEAGRGPLAGPVVAAAVILPPDFPVEILADSKKLSERKRLEAERIIKEKALFYSVTRFSHKVIDEINILNASLLAMKRCLEKIQEKTDVDLFLVDGNRKPDVSIPCTAVIKGDAKIPEIMAASILAKTERDRIMELCDEKWPEYEYKKHKGYPTKEHIEKIALYGDSPIRRKSFHLKENGSEELSLF